MPRFTILRLKSLLMKISKLLSRLNFELGIQTKCLSEEESYNLQKVIHWSNWLADKLSTPSW